MTADQLAAAAHFVVLAAKTVPEMEWILQCNDETKPLWTAVVAMALPLANVSLLWDPSCGRGIALDPSALAPAPAGFACGYAGGLTKESIGAVLTALRKGVASDGASIWLDMESGVRSTYDGKEDRFDVHKAWAVCCVLDEVKWDDEAAFMLMESKKPKPPANVRVSGHAVLAHKTTLLRDRRTRPREFRTLLREVTFYLGYEMTRDVQCAPRHDIVTPLGISVRAGRGQATRLACRVSIVPVMRAGLGMVDSLLEMLPNAEVHQIGMFKGGKSGFERPIEYYSRLPKRGGAACDLAVVLDVVIATSRTIHSVLAKLKAWGAREIVVIAVLASRDGLEALHAQHPDVKVYLAQVDDGLTLTGELLPGLGDAGDRLFGGGGVPQGFLFDDGGDGGGASSSLYGATKKDDSVYDSPLSTALAARAVATSHHPGGFVHQLAAARAAIDDEPSTKVLGDYSGGPTPRRRSAALVSSSPEGSETTDDAIDPPTDIGRDVATQLTTHDGTFGPAPLTMAWGAATAEARGPVLATTRHTNQRNAIGAHAGGYSIYRALAVVSGGIDTTQMPKLGLTTPAARIGPHASWLQANTIVTMDPWGHAISEGFGAWLKKGYDVRPTIAVTKAHVEVPECKEALRAGRLVADGLVLAEGGTSVVTKAAIEPVWYLPGVAKRFGVDESDLRAVLFAETNSMYPELITRTDLKVFLPPIGGMTVYIWGDVNTLADESVELTCRVHDECNGSDVFGSDICTCRPYLTHAIEECIKTAQRGGNGVVVYFRKEGRALGEVTKYLVYNMRKRQEGGDRAAE